MVDKHIGYYVQRWRDEELTEEDKDEILEHPVLDRHAKLQTIAEEIRQERE